MAKPKKQQHFSGANSASKPNLSDFNSLLQTSKSSLQARNFTCAHKFALLAQLSDPAHHDPPLLLAISSVLKAPPSDNYAVLNLPPFTQNPSLIKTHFHNLKSLLNPTQNPSLPFASEAYDLVLKSWSVLSDSEEKMRYDQGFGDGGGKVDSFWTICPYCYHLFEYLKAYEGCCFRCPNGKCQKAFQGVALGQPPPEEVVEKGEYSCPGFVVFTGEDQVGGSVWNPFSLLGSFPCGKNEEEEKKKDVCIEISDDEMEDHQDMGKAEREQSFEANVENMEVDCGVKIEENVEIGGEKMAGEVEKGQGCSGDSSCGKRIKKSVPRTCRKIMGKGVRVKRGEVLSMQGRVDDLGYGGGDKSGLMNHGTETGNLEFNIGDDDIFVMLQDVVVPTV